jgi:curli biogenesis system outer membrane secretion channel CsgG
VRRISPRLAALAAAALGSIAAGCATTTHDRGPAEATWRRGGAAPAAAAAGSTEPVAVYVASFGLAPSVAADHPELTSAQVGLGVSNRIADALYDTGRFRFLEEKAEVAARIAGLLARGAAGAEAGESAGETPAGETAAEGAPAEAGDDETAALAAPPEARWLLYGEVVAVEVERRESVAGVVGRSEVETRVGVQIRLVDRETRRFVPATATGAHVGRSGGREGDLGALDPAAVGAATAEAVRKAAAALVAKLGPS